MADTNARRAVDPDAPQFSSRGRIRVAAPKVASQPAGSRPGRTDDGQQRRRANAGGGAIYGLGIFGAWVYFWQQADSFWEYVLVLLQGLFWPAWMVYEGFAALNA